MRILLFSSSYAPRTGGLETVTRRLARELHDRGHQIVVVTNRYPRNLPAREEIDGILVIRQYYPDVITGLTTGPWWRRVREVFLFLLIPFVLIRLAALILRFRPDIVNAHYLSYPAAYVLVAAKILRRPVVLSFHGSDMTGVPFPSIRYDVVHDTAVRLSDGYTTCSNDLLRYLEPSLPPARRTRAIAIHNGVDVQPVGVAIPAVPKPFVFVPSRLVEKKGVRVIIEAIALLRERGCDTTAVLAGDGPQHTRLERLARDLDVAPRVIFLGAVPHDVSRALAACSVLVVLPAYWEAFGIAALEAMMAEKPVVASNTGGLPEIVVDGQTGFLVPPGDAAGFADAIQALFAHPERAAAMGHRGRERAERHFTWTRTADEYLSAYRQALDGSPAPHTETASTRG
jgi:glycosyltransferase involved in cell wall biosynthesis